LLLKLQALQRRFGPRRAGAKGSNQTQHPTRFHGASPSLFASVNYMVLKAVKEKCAPASTLSDTDFANKILASKDNQSYVREATLAKERNNAARRLNYSRALGEIKNRRGRQRFS
jgi:hypothetical protein